MHYDFKKPVYVGDTITCEFTVTEIDQRDRATAAVCFRNQHDIVVIEATLTGVLPNEEEKRVMAAMVAEGDPTNNRGWHVQPGSHTSRTLRNGVMGH